ncbi:MAG: ketopantoate reductase family protein [Candidatus Melainabacteria bacterium]|nr:ketopantoate reductase family protein [Candidatus Melainabacteria bacterium]
MKTLVLGAGAVGGYYGGRLVEAGRDVTFLVRPKRAELMRKNGLKIKGESGDFESKNFQVIEKPDKLYDLLILTCKAWDLDGAMDSVLGAVGPNSTVLPLLNGMSHLQKMKDKFGAQRVIGGLCIISSTLDSDGTILHLNDKHGIKYGELSGPVTDRINAIDELFKPANCHSKKSGEIIADMWEKWVMISSLAALTTLFGASIGEIASSPYGEKIADLIYKECLAIANAHGFKPSTAFGERLLDKSSTLKASMCRDMENGNQIEADQIIGDLVRKAEEQKVPVPYLETVYCNLKVYEARVLR